MGRNTEVAIRAANTRIKDGLHKHYATQPLIINGVKWTAAKIIAALETEEAQFDEASLNRAAWLAAVKALRKTTQVNHQLRLALRATLEATHGRNSEAVTDFGYAWRTRRRPAAETIKVAVNKRRATRAARGTLGPKQRKPIKGVVPAK
jgi:hypothetical protein